MSHRDPVSVHVLQQRGTPPDGVTTVRVDLAAFFDMVPQVGRDPALLLLTIRALRQRSGRGIRLDDLTWIMGARARRIRAWLDRLATAGCLIYDATDGTVEIELPEPPPPTWTDVHPPHIPLRFELPTHWFIHALPRLGRATFVTYLYLLRRDGLSAPATLELTSLAREAAFRTTLHARWHLARLRRRGLVAPDAATESLVVMDPPPLTPAARRWLRQRRMTGMTPRRLMLVVVLVAVVLSAVVLLARTALGA
ncbi:MAG TPA: hypothetical protein VF266_21255 [Thermoanaerobaculia bacterium]